MKKLWVPVLMVVVIITGIIYINPAVVTHNRQFEKAVSEIKVGEQFTFEDVTPFPWDIIYTFAPYTSKEDMEKTIGIKSRFICETYSEGMTQLIFVKDKKVVASICAYPDGVGFSMQFTGKITNGNKTKFILDKNDGGCCIMQQPLFCNNVLKYTLFCDKM